MNKEALLAKKRVCHKEEEFQKKGMKLKILFPFDEERLLLQRRGFALKEKAGVNNRPYLKGKNLLERRKVSLNKRFCVYYIYSLL